MRARYIIIPLIAALLAVPAGMAYVDWSKGGSGAGLYSREWQPDSMHGYWDPANFYRPVKTVTGTFKGEECVACHEQLTPGIVADWRSSRHGRPAAGKEPVYCPACHGNDHQALRLPTPEVCGACHSPQHQAFLDERRYGFPSHALAMERAVDTKHFVDKPKAEVTACLQCHSVASKCDSCHTRHRFSAAEARRAESCITCHSGPPHPDDETYFASAHGQKYLAEGAGWDWSKPLAKGNYPAPTCAYCHMAGGKHQVADKSIWQFGTRQVNPLTSENKVKRERWVAVCADCHDAAWSRERLAETDRERVRAWNKLYAAERILKDLRAAKLLYPAAGERPPYPADWLDRVWPKERIGFYEGQASAFYNVSVIERDYFEMWYFAGLSAYKGAAHGAPGFVAENHAAMDRGLAAIAAEAEALRTAARAGKQRPDPRSLWLRGEYTDHNREHN